jgi:hypothetical protein
MFEKELTKSHMHFEGVSNMFSFVYRVGVWVWMFHLSRNDPPTPAPTLKSVKSQQASNSM